MNQSFPLHDKVKNPKRSVFNPANANGSPFQPFFLIVYWKSQLPWSQCLFQRFTFFATFLIDQEGSLDHGLVWKTLLHLFYQQEALRLNCWIFKASVTNHRLWCKWNSVYVLLICLTFSACLLVHRMKLTKSWRRTCGWGKIGKTTNWRGLLMITVGRRIFVYHQKKYGSQI